jgi:hypothetical protein
MRKHFVLLASCLAAALAGCSKPETPQSPADTQQANAATAGPAIDACALLTSEEIESVQGEPIKETKSSRKSDGGLAVSQCYFALPTFVNSISLRVVQKSGGPDGRDPKQVWEETFAPDKLQDLEREGGKKKLAPQRIADLGDAAFWIGSPAGGLYALKGNSYIRISVGGAGDQETKIKKSKDLAEMVLKRL